MDRAKRVRNSLEQIVMKGPSGRETLHPVLLELRRLIEGDITCIRTLETEAISDDEFSARLAFHGTRAIDCGRLFGEAQVQLQRLTELHAKFE